MYVWKYDIHSNLSNAGNEVTNAFAGEDDQDGVPDEEEEDLGEEVRHTLLMRSSRAPEGNCICCF